MTRNKTYIKIDLIGVEADDGRIYVESPDLEGFHFILEPDEEPLEAMEETLLEFMKIYLKAEIANIMPAESPRQFRRKQMNIPMHHIRSSGYTVLAEMAV